MPSEPAAAVRVEYTPESDPASATGCRPPLPLVANHQETPRGIPQRYYSTPGISSPVSTEPAQVEQKTVLPTDPRGG